MSQRALCGTGRLLLVLAPAGGDPSAQMGEDDELKVAAVKALGQARTPKFVRSNGSVGHRDGERPPPLVFRKPTMHVSLYVCVCVRVGGWVGVCVCVWGVLFQP